MASLLVLGFAAIVSGAAIQQRDPVPAGYVAAPYYPGMSEVQATVLVLIFATLTFPSPAWRMDSRLE